MSLYNVVVNFTSLLTVEGGGRGSRHLAERGGVCLAIVLQKGLEAFAGEEDAALHCAKGEIHLLCDFVVLVAGHMHREGDAVVVGEGVDGFGNLTGGDGAFGSFETRLLGEIEVIEIFGLVDDRGRAHHLAVVVDEDVAHDGEDPSFEVNVVDILIFIVERLERGVLKKIVSIVAVRGQQICKVQ